jgi:pimeloyl-ACP methyl ester carboxylesterase
MSNDPARLAARARLHRLAFDGVDCVWREWGSGPPLVLVHGGTGSWLHWVRNIEALSAHHRVFAPDLAGFGDSGDAPAGFGAPGQARLLQAGLVRLADAAHRPVLVGFSFGAIVAGLAAQQAGAAVGGLLLVGAVGLGIDRGPPLPLRAWKHLADPAEIERAHRHNLRTLMLADDASVDPLALQIQAANARAARFYSRRASRSAALADALARLSVPVAGIWGSEDATAACDPDRVAARLRALRPEAPLTILRGAGHWVQYEAAAAFDAACLHWLAAIAAERAAPASSR